MRLWYDVQIRWCSEESIVKKARVGIVGAGQLARMSLGPALALGLDVRLLASSLDDSAARVWPDVMIGFPDDPAAVRLLAQSCTVTTFDHELVDTVAIAELEADGLRFAPGSWVMAVSQSKQMQRNLFARLGFKGPAFSVVADGQESVLDDFLAEHGQEIVIKADRGGYDGRGVFVSSHRSGACDFVNGLLRQDVSVVLEASVPIDKEVAILVARSPSGEVCSYPVVETVQEQGMLRELIAPADILPALLHEAARIGEMLVAELNIVGLLAVEFFVSNGSLLVNEIATRPHNSGHYSIDACVTSQFEQHLRAIVGMPLGDPAMRCRHAVTVNVVGFDERTSPTKNAGIAASVRGAHIHLYGKQPRAGRKLGHVTATGNDLEDVLLRARRAANLLMKGEA
ncbi:5-(carboxyamino)imidazole ribonucleotide synthase [soil metagenome]